VSVRVMSWVWEHSQSGPTQRLVLLAIADCANDSGAEAYPSMSKLRMKTGLSERAIQGALKNLSELGELVVYLNAGPKGCNRYRITMPTPAGDAPPQEMRGAGDAAPPHDVHPSPAGNAGDPPQQMHPNHPSTIKEPSVKTSRPQSEPPKRPDVEEICSYLADKIVKNGSRRPRITPEWRNQARLLLDKDGCTVEMVKKAIDWCQADPFWSANILSMPKLREKYDQLRLAAKRPNGRVVERDGLRLKPETAENLARRERFAQMDAANDQKAIDQ
jgi:hypothetical protein